MNIKKHFLYLIATVSIVFFSSVFGFAANAELTKILNKYTSSKTVSLDLKKTDEKIALGTKETSDGTLKYSKNRIHVVLNSDKKVEFYYNNNTIWLVEYPDKDFDKDGKRKVTVVKKNTPVLMKSLINLFSSKKKFLKEFKVINERTEDGQLIVDFEPQYKNLKKFSLEMDIKKQLISKVIFIDDVDTKTILELSNLKTNKKLSSSEFQFKKNKTDEVIYEQ